MGGRFRQGETVGRACFVLEMVLERHSFLTGGGQKFVDGSAEQVEVGADAEVVQQLAIRTQCR